MLGLGQAMVYGVLRLINFAHGDVFMVGVFVGWLAGTYLARTFALPLVPTLALAMVVCAITNYLIERLGYRPLRNAPRLSMLLTALAISMFLEHGTQALTGTQLHAFPNLISPATHHWGPVYVSNASILVAVSTLIAMVVVDFLVFRTRTGKAMRAVSYNMQAAVLMGINVNAVISWVFVIGGALAGLAGVVYGLAYPAIDPFMGLLPGLKGFVAVAIGGIGSIRGAVLGGFLLGYAETFAGGFLPSALKDTVAFVLLIIVLMIRPSGLLNVPWYTERI
jgi:branched-chain amino acid transport system permease protein